MNSRDLPSLPHRLYRLPGGQLFWYYATWDRHGNVIGKVEATDQPRQGGSSLENKIIHRSVLEQADPKGQRTVGAPVIAEATNVKIRCPKCGRDVESLVCGHCGSTLESWQSDLYGAAIRQIARLGGVRADAGHEGGNGDPSTTAVEGWEPRTEARGNGGHGKRWNRPGDDFYPTPPEAVEALLRCEEFPGPIWEPACGDGAISKVLIAHGHKVDSSDKVNRGYGEVRNFLKTTRTVPIIVTNPPYNQAEAFIDHALTCATEKVAMLLRLSFLEGQERYENWKQWPLKTVWVFSKRISLYPGHGFHAFAWYVFDKSHQGPPEIRWISPELMRNPDGDEDIVAEGEEDDGSEPYNAKPELSLADRAAILKAGKQAPEHGIVYSPPHVVQFLFDLLSPLSPKIVLDVAAGTGALSLPWRAVARIIEYELGFGRDFFRCPDSIAADLVLCNPPFGQEKEFLRRILRVVPETTPIALICTHRVRLGSYPSSKDWTWCRDEWPPITSIVSLPRGVFKGVNETTEVLLFRTPSLLPHYFLPSEMKP